MKSLIYSFCVIFLIQACNSLDEVTGIVPYYKISIVAGNNQEDTLGAILEDALVILISNQAGLPMEGISVHFDPENGSIDGEDPLVKNTDSLGIVRVQWQLGPETGTQRVSVSIPNSNIKVIPDKVDFNATASIVCPDFFEDERDGQIYTAKRFGSQCWMTKNLNYGEFITSVNNQDPQNASLEKFCYDNLEANCYENDFGALYQIEEAVGNPKACPDGWAIPTEKQWQELEIYFGVDIGMVDPPIESILDSAGGISKGVEDSLGYRLMKKDPIICPHNICGTSGFDLVLNGRLNKPGMGSKFLEKDSVGHYWTKTPIRKDTFYIRNLRVVNPGIATSHFIKDQELGSIRCIKI